MRLLGRFGYHLASLGLIVVSLATEWTSPLRAVVAAIALQFALSFLDSEHWLTPRRLALALAAVPAACCSSRSLAVAGIIVGVVVLTGLGLALADIMVGIARRQRHRRPGSRPFSAIAIMLLGLAVPVTARFIISLVIVSPALVDLGVAPAVAMFVFYYAVLRR